MIEASGAVIGRLAVTDTIVSDNSRSPVIVLFHQKVLAMNHDELPHTPEGIAYLLLQKVIEAEGRSTATGGTGSKLSRNLILDVYAECLEAVQGKRPRRGRAATVTHPAP